MSLISAWAEVSSNRVRRSMSKSCVEAQLQLVAGTCYWIRERCIVPVSFVDARCPKDPLLVGACILSIVLRLSSLVCHTCGLE